jgi:hypothetical protein
VIRLILAQVKPYFRREIGTNAVTRGGAQRPRMSYADIVHSLRPLLGLRLGSRNASPAKHGLAHLGVRNFRLKSANGGTIGEHRRTGTAHATSRNRWIFNQQLIQGFLLVGTDDDPENVARTVEYWKR